MKILAVTVADFARIGTEQIGTHYPNLHSMSIGDLTVAMNQNDAGVAEAVSRELPSITMAIEKIVERMARGGRLIYVGAGTSGRLGVLDASECPPTFNSSQNQVVGIIAGGEKALTTSIEGAEDSVESAVKALQILSLRSEDCVVGIAASGRTPFVIAALEAAAIKSCLTVGISCSKDSSLSEFVDCIVEVDCGPEILAGSTRLKAGTATKMILNMISTISMIKLGKVYQNLMVDLQVTNGKLHARAIAMLIKLTAANETSAEEALAQANGSVRHALVILAQKVSMQEAQNLLNANGGNLDRILGKDE